MVAVTWYRIASPDEPTWGLRRVLYAYLVAPSEIVYIGKADYRSVRERWRRSAKPDFWNDLERERGIRQHAVLVGGVDLEPGRRLSAEFLADVESLLIHRIRPWGNIASTKTRIARPGLIVDCHGEWPLRQRRFRDD
jgi:hypothetical protein